MNCEDAQETMLDELYGELDREAAQALAAHRAECASCEAEYAGLAAGKKFAALAEPALPPGLEERVLAAALAEVDAQGAEPAPASAVVARPSPLGDVVSLAGRWAMRPQARMAAVFLLMIGSSALLLRRGYGEREGARSISVSEEGAPGAPAAAAAAPADKVFGGAIPGSPEPVHGATRGVGGVAPPAPLAEAAPAAAAPTAAAAKAGPAMDRDQALAAARKGDCEGALPSLDGRSGDAEASLAAARCVKQTGGCSTAVSRFEQLAATTRDAAVNADATLEAGLCQRQLGNLDAAMKRFQALAAVPSHAARAAQEIETTKGALRARAAAAKPAATKAE